MSGNTLMSEVIHLKNILLSHTQKMANKLWLLIVLKTIGIVIFSFAFYCHQYLVYCRTVCGFSSLGCPHKWILKIIPSGGHRRGISLVYYSVQLPSVKIMGKAFYDLSFRSTGNYRGWTSSELISLMHIFYY